MSRADGTAVFSAAFPGPVVAEGLKSLQEAFLPKGKNDSLSRRRQSHKSDKEGENEKKDLGDIYCFLSAGLIKNHRFFRKKY